VDALTDTELFRWLASLGWLDRIALGVVVIAALRGLWIGLLREAFSIGALAAAFVAVKLWTDPATAWLLGHSPWDLSLSDRQAHIVGGALVGILAAFVVVAVGGFIRKRVRATPLGWLDRLLGGALGTAEGALVVAVALIGVVAFVGQNHEVLAGSRSIELLSRARVLADELPDVASPPPGDEDADAQSDGDASDEGEWEEAPEAEAPRELEIDFLDGDEVSV
jgi:membrane protein required for colicin V production